MALMVLGLGACGKPDAVARYDCSAKGERSRMRRLTSASEEYFGRNCLR